jgi:prepilin-type N-terminal cleavage/methylation domain-containing protein
VSGNKSGFSLIEIIVAIAIIGVMAAIVIPRLNIRTGRELDLLVDRLANLTAQGYERAILNGTIHRVYFSFKEPAQVELQEAQPLKKGESELQFKKVPADYNKVSFLFDERFIIKNFFIKGHDEAARGVLKDAFFYILPDGTSQEIIINILDSVTSDEAGLVLNPFLVKFTVYDTFQKP